MRGTSVELSTSYARKSPRIRCQLPVQIRREGDDAAGVDPVVAHTIDVSRGGIRVETPLWLAVGEPLVCRMNLHGQDAALHGHVAWSSASGNSTGLGISFGELTAEVARRLDDLVRATLPDAEPVELRFEGLPTPIRARAITTPGGIRLATALPVLARDAGVVFRYGEPLQTYTGHVADVALQEREGARILEVDVEVVPHDRKRFRRHAQYAHAPVNAQPEPPRAARARGATRPLWQPASEPSGTSRAPEAPASTATAPAALRRFRAWRDMLLVGGLAGAVGVAAIVAEPSDDPVSQATPTPARQPAPQAPAARPAAAIAPAPEDTAVAGPPAAPVSTAPAAPATAGVLQVSERPGEAELSLPFEGSMAGVVTTRWVAPNAWVLNFPMARTPLPDGSYRLGARMLETLRVQRTTEGLSLRVLTRSQQPSPRLTQHQDRLVVSFRRTR
jgi:hypothetical protein